MPVVVVVVSPFGVPIHHRTLRLLGSSQSPLARRMARLLVWTLRASVRLVHLFQDVSYPLQGNSTTS